MNRVELLNLRYASSASVARNGVEIIAVGDPAGARLDAVVRRLLLLANADGPGIWDNLIGPSRSLRWRRMTQPQPAPYNSAIQSGCEEVVRQAGLVRGAVDNSDLLDELAAAATGVSESTNAIGEVLLRNIGAIGAEQCVVVASSRAAQVGISAWLVPRGIRVRLASQRDPESPVAHAYVIGPPQFFPSSLVTAPATNDLTFFVSAWLGDRSVPYSPIAPYAEGAIRIASRVQTEGEFDENDSENRAAEVQDDIEQEYRPQPEWGPKPSNDREPGNDEVDARKVLLCGGLAIWLDDGDRIRVLDPAQPLGERVVYSDVSAVSVGTYLLIRQGETERKALYRAAIRRLAGRGAAVDATQQRWKDQLANRLSSLGYRTVVAQLRSRDVQTAERTRAWVEPSLIRPHSDRDFEGLLQWLELPVQPTFGNASLLRRTLYQVSADIREELETAVSAADLSVLESTGYLSLDVTTSGFRGIAATCVTAISPHFEIIARHDARVPFPDRSGLWLE